MLDYWTINSKLRKSFPMSTFILFCLSLYLFKPFALATKQFHVEYSVVKLILQLSENKVFGWGWNKKKMATNYHVNEIRILFFVSVCVWIWYITYRQWLNSHKSNGEMYHVDISMYVSILMSFCDNKRHDL